MAPANTNINAELTMADMNEVYEEWLVIEVKVNQTIMDILKMGQRLSTTGQKEGDFMVNSDGYFVFTLEAKCLALLRSQEQLVVRICFQVIGLLLTNFRSGSDTVQY